jgi:hypothetical protein
MSSLTQTPTTIKQIIKVIKPIKPQIGERIIHQAQLRIPNNFKTMKVTPVKSEPNPSINQNQPIKISNLLRY